ncbi:MAG: presenilin, partial [Thaumarchaeota archaeon]|nr:presenilin [Nitrososphaerota archaeon]
YVQIVNSAGYSFNLLGPTPAGATGNAIILVGLAFVLTLALVWLLRKKMVMSFRLAIFGSTALSAFILTSLTADVFAQNYLPPILEVPVAYGSASVVVALIAYTIFVKNRLWLSTLILAFVGAEVGSFFAETLSPFTALALPIAFSLYDIYAVFRGPLKQLIGTAPNIALVGMSIKAGEFTLGLGDIVFYTMLPSLAFFWVGTFAAIATLVAIDVGVVVTLYLLSKRRLLPGLPIPMLLGVLTFAVYYF